MAGGHPHRREPSEDNEYLAKTLGARRAEGGCDESGSEDGTSKAKKCNSTIRSLGGITSNTACRGSGMLRNNANCYQ